MQKSHITRIHHPSGKLYEAWCDFVGQHPEGNFFQSQAFFRLNRHWPGAEAVLLLMVDTQHQVTGSLLAVVLHEGSGLSGWLSARTVVYGGPLLSRQRRLQEHMSVDAILKALIKEVGGKSAFIQFCNFRDWSDFQPVFDNNGFRFEERQNLIVGTSKRIKAWKGLSDNCRSQVRSSLNNGARVITHPNKKQIDEFYDILSRLYKTKVRKPLPPPAFFEAFAAMCHIDDRSGDRLVNERGSEEARGGHDEGETGRENETGGEGERGRGGEKARRKEGETGWWADGAIGRGVDEEGLLGANPYVFQEEKDQKGNGVILLIEVDARVVGGIVCPMMPERCMYEWYVCGLDREMRHHDIYPSVLVTWSALEYAADNDIPFFEFMSTGSPGQPYGVRDLMACFGGDRVNHGRYMRINSKLRHAIASIAYKRRRRL